MKRSFPAQARNQKTSEIEEIKIPWNQPSLRGWCSIPKDLKSALEWIRTIDTRFRRAVLYPLSYEGKY